MKKALFHAALVIALCSLAGLGTSFFRFFDYFNHFRPQALAAGLALLPVCLLARARSAAWLALAVILLNGGLMGWRAVQFWPPAPFEEGGTVPLKIISANVLVGNERTEALLAQIAAHDPDIVIIVELSPHWREAMRVLDQKYRYGVAAQREDSFGIALYSKWPFTHKIIRNGWYELPLLQAEFQQFTLFAAHPVSPMSRLHRMELRTYMRNIGQAAAALTKPVILAGDLNATLWSDSVQPLAEVGFKQIGGPLHYTWPSYFPPAAIQIDHVFAKNGVTGRLRVLGDIGSDHFPVLAELQVPAGHDCSDIARPCQ